MSIELLLPGNLFLLLLGVMIVLAESSSLILTLFRESLAIFTLVITFVET